MEFRLKVLVPALFGVVALLPSGVFAQQPPPPVVQTPSQQALCGSIDLPVVRTGEILMPQPDAVGRPDEGVIDFSAVRGEIVHMSGPMVLLQLDEPGAGNTGPRHELAGDNWAVVQLPAECSLTEFSRGMAIIAIGTPDGRGVLEAVAVTEAA
jgi:hypothetical protein